MRSTIDSTIAKEPLEMINHGHKRIDDYYWMRLTDEQKALRSRCPNS